MDDAWLLLHLQLPVNVLSLFHRRISTLRPSSVYFFRVTSVSCEGKGTRSSWVEARTPPSSLPADEPAADKRQPGSPSVTLVQSFAKSIFLSWRAPTEGGHVVGYKVGYSDGIPDLNWRYVSGSHRNITIGNLSASFAQPITACILNITRKSILLLL